MPRYCRDLYNLLRERRHLKFVIIFLGRRVCSSRGAYFCRVSIRVDFVDETVGIAILHNAANLFGLFHVNGIIFIVGDDKNLIFPRALIVILYIIV